jgi:hypothetical protein
LPLAGAPPVPDELLLVLVVVELLLELLEVELVVAPPVPVVVEVVSLVPPVPPEPLDVVPLPLLPHAAARRVRPTVTVRGSTRIVSTSAPRLTHVALGW